MSLASNYYTNLRHKYDYAYFRRVCVKNWKCWNRRTGHFAERVSLLETGCRGFNEVVEHSYISFPDVSFTLWP